MKNFQIKTGFISFYYTCRQTLPSFLKRKTTAEAVLFGKPFRVSKGIKEFIECREQIVEKDQYHTALIKPNDFVIDAGANAGVFSVFVAAKHPNTTIYAFEPTPETFSNLKENTKYYKNIHAFNDALGETEKRAIFVINPNSSESNRVEENNYITQNGFLRAMYRTFKLLACDIRVKIKTIDSLNIRCDFLKMDTEGYEVNILKGATKTIKKWKPIIAMSAYHKPNDKKELPLLLNSIAPYKCELFHDAEEDFICKPL